MVLAALPDQRLGQLRHATGALSPEERRRRELQRRLEATQVATPVASRRLGSNGVARRIINIDFNGKKLELNLILFPNPQIKTGFKFKLPKNLPKVFTGLLTNTEEFNNHFIDNIESTTPMTKDISIVPVYEEYNDGNKSFIRKINQLRLK
jgi:hypothetical protein